MKILLSSWMQELDGEAIHKIGIPSIVLMENASQGAARFFARRFPLEESFRDIIVVAGKGNNGGDGIAVGRILHQQGYNVRFLLLAAPEKLNTDPKINFDIIRELGLPYTVIRDEAYLDEVFEGCRRYTPDRTVVIDAIFGTGLNKPVTQGIYAAAIDWISNCGFKVAAIDIPSGLSDAFLPEEGTHVVADVTATFQCLKTAHVHPDGNKYCGSIEVIDIGIPFEKVNNDKYYINVITPADFGGLLTTREIDAHKGHFGHVLTIAGSLDKPGAGILSSYAVLRVGAGLCTAAVYYENHTAAVAVHPEIMTLTYKEAGDLIPSLTPFNTILAGPGLGDTGDTLATVSMLLKHATVPLVFDADALNVISRDVSILDRPRKADVVLTPHPGEFSRLTGKPWPEIRKNRIRHSREFAMKHNVYLVLKGHHTIVASPGGQIFINTTGNPGMATAGSGDVLSGMIAGMCCQFERIYGLDYILQAAVYIHGYAGDLGVLEIGEASLTAVDVIDYIPRTFLKLKANEYNSPFSFS